MPGLGAILTILYLFRLFSRVFLGEARGGKQAVEGSSLMVACVVALAVLSLAAGILVGWPTQLAQTAISQMPGVVR